MLWNYGIAYQDQLSQESSDLLLYFLVLPMCWHSKTLSSVSSTRTSSGLGKLCEKLGSEREELLAIHERALRLRTATLRSVAFGVRAGLFYVEYREGKLRAVSSKAVPKNARIEEHFRGARKLGAWFQKLETVHIFRALQVEA
ncbi:MAG: three component ABC system middle component [Pseudomonadales bacterium]